jgi:hypothetical protein
MRTLTTSSAALTAAILIGAACGGGEVETGPRLGTPEYSWQLAADYVAAGAFDKAIEPLDNLAAGDSELKNKAILWRTVLLDGLARGHQELAEGYRLAMAENPKMASKYQNPLQQAYRDARQYSIELVESLGDLEKALAASSALDCPFPPGGPAKPASLTALEKGDELHASQLTDLQVLTVGRGVILAVTEMAGKGEAANDAQTAFAAGPVSLDPDKTRLTVVKMLLDRSVVFDKKHLYQPDVRKIDVDSAEKWNQPYLESANEELKKQAEQLQKEIEDERLELEGKRRRLEARG